MKSIVSQYLKVAVKQMVSMELTGEASITFDDNIKRTTDFIKHYETQNIWASLVVHC